MNLHIEFRRDWEDRILISIIEGNNWNYHLNSFGCGQGIKDIGNVAILPSWFMTSISNSNFIDTGYAFYRKVWGA